MDTLHWRKSAKWVAYMDLVLSSLHLLAIVLISILAAQFFTGDDADDDDTEISDAWHVPTTTKVILWVAVAFLGAVTLLQAWATLELLSATEVKDGEIIKALKKCGHWRNVQLIVLVIQCADHILMGYYVIFVIGLLIRGSFLFIVYQFMEELDNLLHPIPPPITVPIPKHN